MDSRPRDGTLAISSIWFVSTNLANEREDRSNQGVVKALDGPEDVQELFMDFLYKRKLEKPHEFNGMQANAIMSSGSGSSM